MYLELNLAKPKWTSGRMNKNKLLYSQATQFYCDLFYSSIINFCTFITVILYAFQNYISKKLLSKLELEHGNIYSTYFFDILKSCLIFLLIFLPLLFECIAFSHSYLTLQSLISILKLDDYMLLVFIKMRFSNNGDVMMMITTNYFHFFQSKMVLYIDALSVNESLLIFIIILFFLY